MNRVPEARLVASGYVQMVDGAGDNFQHTQGCSAALSGGAGIATITLVEEVPLFDLDLTYAITNGPDGCSMKAGISGRTITFLAHTVAGVLVNVAFTFSVRQRGKLR
jgi:hypothetical protein